MASAKESKRPSLHDYELTLYHQYPTRSTRVKWLLLELGIDGDVRTVQMRLQKREQFGAEYRRVNPAGAIPALVVEERRSGRRVTMTESAAICTFLTDLAAGGAALKPAAGNVFGTAQYQRVIAMVAGSIDPLLWDVRLHESILAPERRVRAVAARGREQFVARMVPALEEIVLDGSVWACHPYHHGFTTADVMLGQCMEWASVYGLLDGSAALTRYLKRVSEREAFQKLKDTPNALL